MATWVPFTEAVFQNALPVFVLEAHAAWVVANPTKVNRMGEIVAAVRAVFREAVQANPANVMDSETDTIPAAGLEYALDMAAYRLWVEMGDLV